MRKAKWTIVLAMAVLLSAPTAWAQMSDYGRTNNANQQGSQTQQGTMQQGSQAGNFGMQMGPAHFVNPSNLIGNALFNANGNQLGTITEVITNRTGQIQYVLVRSQQSENQGNQQNANQNANQNQNGNQFCEQNAVFYPIPWNAIHVNMKDNALSVNTARDNLAGAPHFTIGSIIAQELQNPEFSRQVFGYYGQNSANPYGQQNANQSRQQNSDQSGQH